MNDKERHTYALFVLKNMRYMKGVNFPKVTLSDFIVCIDDKLIYISKKPIPNTTIVTLDDKVEPMQNYIDKPLRYVWNATNTPLCLVKPVENSNIPKPFRFRETIKKFE